MFSFNHDFIWSEYCFGGIWARDVDGIFQNLWKHLAYSMCHDSGWQEEYLIVFNNFPGWSFKNIPNFCGLQSAYGPVFWAFIRAIQSSKMPIRKFFRGLVRSTFEEMIGGHAFLSTPLSRKA
jgi:hypothetical protein